MKLTDKQIQIIDSIKPLLPFGAQGTIAEATGVRRETVNKVLNKKWWNQDVVNAALELINEQKDKLTSLGNKLIK